MSKERIIELRGADQRAVFLHERLGKYIQRLVAATRPVQPDTDWRAALALGAGRAGRRSRAPRRARSSAGAGWPRSGRCCSGERTEVYPEDIQDLAPYVLGHRIWLGPHAASHGLTTER